MKREKYWIVGILIWACVGMRGMDYVCSLATDGAFSGSVFAVAVFAGMVFMLLWTGRRLKVPEDGKLKKRRIIYAEAAAFFFALSLVLGYQLKVYGMTECGFAGKGLILFRALALSAALFPITYLLFERLEGRPGGRSDSGELRAWDARKIFFFSWLIVMICWIPVFLAYYPAVMSYDFNVQSIQAQGSPGGFHPHHPLVHTWLIWLAYQIGRACGSLEIGMACHSLFQMLLFSAALAYSCAVIYRLCRKKGAVIAALLFYGIFPYNSVLAVSVTKDVIFAALFLAFVLLLIERFYFKHGGWMLEIGIFLEGILMMLFRNNAIYAAAAFVFLGIILSHKKARLRVLIWGVCLVIGGYLAHAGVRLACGTDHEGHDIEKYSVLIQQFARVGFYHGEEMDQDIYDLLDLYVSHDAWENYYPPLADSVKIQVSQQNFEEHWEGKMADVWKAWAAIGRRYPNEYIDAFLSLTAGYWFIDDHTWADNLWEGPDSHKGALFTFNASVSYFLPEGIAEQSKIPWLKEMLNEIVTNNSFYRVPVLSNLFKPAFYCWALILLLVSFMYQKRRKALLITLCPLCYLATLLLGPVVIVRYVLVIIVLIPVLAALLMHREKERSDDEKERRDKR